MPHVLDDTDVQEYSSPASEYDALYERSRVLPASRRGHFTLWASLRSLFIPLRRLRPTRAQARPVRTPQEPEMSMDTLARKYPDIYLRITSWSC
jgi:hypothetical protein